MDFNKRRMLAPTVNPNWKDDIDRLRNGLREIDRESERQELLSALSVSETRNLQLENALAKLAREKERIAILERERILKRAQVAQATAQIVYEANWAKSRMESEMKQAKMRAMVFNDPPGWVAPPMPVQLEQNTDDTKNPPLESSVPVNSGGEVVAAISDPSPPIRPALVTTTEVATSNPPPIHVDPTPVEPIVSPMAGITDLVTNTAGSIFSNVLNAYYGEEPLVDSVTGGKPPAVVVSPVVQERVPPSEVQKPAQIARQQTDSQKELVENVLPQPSLQPSSPALNKTGTMPLSNLRPPPSAMDDAGFQSKAPKKIATFQKGEWTIPDLLVQAQTTVQTAQTEKEDLIAKNKNLYESIFGLSDGSVGQAGKAQKPPVTVDPAWQRMQSEWLRLAAPEQREKKIMVKQKTRIQSTEDLINESLGGMPQVTDGSPKLQETSAVSLAPGPQPPGHAPTREQVEAPEKTKDGSESVDSNGKKKCVIM